MILSREENKLIHEWFVNVKPKIDKRIDLLLKDKRFIELYIK